MSPNPFYGVTWGYIRSSNDLSGHAEHSEAKARIWDTIPCSRGILRSLLGMEKPEKLISSTDFEHLNGQAPSFTMEKKQPGFSLDAQQVILLKMF